MTIIGLTGFIGAGKGTVSDIITSRYYYVEHSFAESLKDVLAAIFGWNRELLEGKTKESRAWRDEVDTWWSEKLGIDNFTPRMAMQQIGTNIMRNKFNHDIWALSLQNRLLKEHHDVVVSDARFPNEIQQLRDAGGVIVRVNNCTTPEWYETLLSFDTDAEAVNYMEHNYPEVHSSEWAWVRIAPDYEIENNSTIAALNNKVDSLLARIM